MICKKCGIEITSEKVWYIHQKECKEIRELTGSEYKDFNKAQLIDYAKDELELELDEKTTKNEMVKLIKKTYEEKVGE